VTSAGEVHTGAALLTVSWEKNSPVPPSHSINPKSAPPCPARHERVVAQMGGCRKMDSQRDDANVGLASNDWSKINFAQRL
jgi:hypothetical protein